MGAGRGRWFVVLAAGLVAAAAVVLAVRLHRPADPRPAEAGPSAYPTTERLCTAGCDARGTMRWSVPVPGPYVESGGSVFPASADGTASARSCSRKAGPAFYLWAGDRLLAYDAASGRLRWNAALPLPPAGAYCQIFADAQHVMVVATDAKDGPDRAGVVSAADGRAVGSWDAPYPHGPGNVPAAAVSGLAGDQAIWLRFSGEVSAVDLATGQPRWTSAVAPFTGYHADGAGLFLDRAGGGLDQVQRLDLATGALTRIRVSAPIGANGRLYIGRSSSTPYEGLSGVLLATSDDSAAAISAADGTVLWRIVTGQVRAPGVPYVQQIWTVDPVAAAVYVDGPQPQQVRRVAARSGETGEPFGASGVKGWTVLGGVGVHTGTVSGGPGLLGDEPATGEVRWRVPGPRSFSGLGTDAAAPLVMVGVGCAGPCGRPTDDALHVCAAPVLVAVNV
ncbi:PQQ-like beta-propeller repeat protein [Dactylosporangium matsuzakiense]|uniref:Pyrrolo-quinoline quinone repeat domain-containing protein n=1 Tax=Dactylosporangium matsuzakiense TaxID=53360 RepID=A0A9W6KWP5_9ACTN|nr:PQQ-like beta-propeller repeat protein [Dactylosporangium matsuzakiense]UWZ41032.1 PQQ-binding-like beta-propeller repeat protein [Dactylosporangium matsuzakiense]GLL08580.1 hypothetical protein GCM10017581_103470 [Dactylosporangium matsuzakiense]